MTKICRRSRAWCNPFERSYNNEQALVRDVYDDYPILSAKQLDEYGDPLPKKVTGYDLIPEEDHDALTAISIRDVYGYDVDDIVARRASEFLRLLAMTRASKWMQETKEQMRINKELKRNKRK